MAGIRDKHIEIEDQASHRQTASLAALAAVLALVVAGLFLVRALDREARLETCLMSGRSNCVILVANSR